MTDHTTLTDEELAGAIKDSDLDAFRVLYYRYYDRLCHFVWARTSRAELAEDVVQEIFTRLWQNRNRYTIHKSLKAYLYRMANNLIIDLHRKKKHESDYRSETDSKQTLARNDHLDLSIDVESAVDKLPEKLRTVFILSRFEDLKYTEIARVCRISIKAVESRIGRALRILRDDLS